MRTHPEPSAPPETELLELGRQLLAWADDALLDASLDGLVGRVDDEDARAVLEGIHEAGDARTIRELLSADALEGWIRTASTPREARLLEAQLRRWLGAGGRSDDDPTRLGRVAALPDDLEGMLRWARPHGLLEELSRPAHEVVLDDGARTSRASLVECALGRIELPAGASLLAVARATDQARAHLEHEAAARAAVGARAALWARPLDEGPIRVLAERLRGAVGDASIEIVAKERFVPASPVHVDVESGVARAALADPRGPIGARLLLSGYEHRALHGECDGCGTSRCPHVAALAARLLDACHDAKDRLHAPLRRFVERPSWKRFLEALRPERTAPAPTHGERLSFRVRLEDERASVGVVQRRAQADGRWSPGKLVSPRAAERRSEAHDRPVLDALSLGARGRAARPIPADLAVLRALVEHPAVELEGSDAPLSVCEHTLHVELIEQPDGIVPRVSLAGASVEPGERPHDARYLARHDAATGALVFAALTPPLRRLLAALAQFRGVLPPESYPALAPWLASIEPVARVSAPRSLRGTERPPPEALLLRITPGRDGGVDVALCFRAVAMGPLWPPGRGPVLSHGFEGGAQVFVRRDLGREREIAERVIAALGLDRAIRLEPFAYRIEGAQEALALLSDAARLDAPVAIEWAEDARPLTVSSTVRSADLSVAVRKKGQLLALEGGARIAGAEGHEADLAIGRLLDAARRRERFVPVTGLGMVELERELFERLARAQLCVQGPAREPTMSTAALPFWLDGLGSNAEGADAATSAWLARARASENAAPVEGEAVPSSAHLRDYQRVGVEWLLGRSRWAPGAILADEMGLGKTVQAIALLEARAPIGPAMVVCPTSVAANWTAEIARFAPGLSARVLRRGLPRSAPKPGTVLVVSYDHLVRHRGRFQGVAFATQVVDEAQMVKNARTARAAAVASVDAAFRVALSGTPVENRLGDLWSLFQLVAPGLLGTWARFRRRFAAPIERDEDAERATALRRLVSPFVLRRTKREVAPELPSRTEVVHRVELSAAEQDLYDAAVRDARRAVARRRRSDNHRSAQILAELTYLRQLACHPRLVVEDPRIESSKLHALLRLLDDILPRGHRALVFSQFTRHLALVREALDAAGVTSLYLDGSTPAADRARSVGRFQGGEGDVFLISLKAGGTGLNLTAADYVVHMDPWWNPAAEDQASDRAHRIGQQRPTTIVKLVTQGTIEERVLALHEDKRRLADAILTGAAVPTALDVEALEGLLSLR